MKLKNLTILLTDKCNYKCSYCYQWSASGFDIDPLIAKKIVNFALENSGSELNLSFSGGEPLLKYDLIEKCVFFIRKKAESLNKKVNFSIITNGSLIDDKVLELFNEYNFDVQYSFDVYLKNKIHDNEIFIKGKDILNKLVNSKNISLSTNTVFTPDKADTIFDSVEFLYNESVKNIGIGIDQTAYWDERSLKVFKEELIKVRELILEEYLSSGEIFVDLFNLNDPSGINTCGASENRLTISPDGGLWGCSAFYYYDWENIEEPMEKYYYGIVDDLDNGIFEKKFEEIRSNYKEFRTDNFKTEKTKCFLCEYLQECRICPAQKYSFIKEKRSIFHIPDQICEINKIIIEANREFKKEVKAIKNP